MTQAAHTPGPWVHDEDCAGRILGPDGVVVCAVYGSVARAQEDDCNQRLIAAAPELLEALEEIESLPVDDYGCREIPPGFLDKARAAIAKAKGN